MGDNEVIHLIISTNRQLVQGNEHRVGIGIIAEKIEEDVIKVSDVVERRDGVKEVEQ
ncbi:hypothetical protein ACH5RR_041036, partial [Cinchona calisaya]